MKNGAREYDIVGSARDGDVRMIGSVRWRRRVCLKAHERRDLAEARSAIPEPLMPSSSWFARPDSTTSSKPPPFCHQIDFLKHGLIPSSQSPDGFSCDASSVYSSVARFEGPPTPNSVGDPVSPPSTRPNHPRAAVECILLLCNSTEQRTMRVHQGHVLVETRSAVAT